MTLLEFIEKRNRKEKIFEAFRTSNGDFDRALELITSFINKRVPNIIRIPNVEDVEMEGNFLKGIRWINRTTGANFRICWEYGKENNAASAYCVDFFPNMVEMLDGYGTSEFTIFCNGASVATILPVIVDVMSTGKLNTSSPLLVKLRQSV